MSKKLLIIFLLLFSAKFVVAVPCDCAQNNLYFSKDDVNFYSDYLLDLNLETSLLDCVNAINGAKIWYGSQPNDFFVIDAIVVECFVNKYVYSTGNKSFFTKFLDDGVVEKMGFWDMLGYSHLVTAIQINQLINGCYHDKAKIEPLIIRLCDKQNGNYYFFNACDGKVYQDHMLTTKTDYFCGHKFFEQRACKYQKGLETFCAQQIKSYQSFLKENDDDFAKIDSSFKQGLKTIKEKNSPINLCFSEEYAKRQAIIAEELFEIAEIQGFFENKKPEDDKNKKDGKTTESDKLVKSGKLKLFKVIGGLIFTACGAGVVLKKRFRRKNKKSHAERQVMFDVQKQDNSDDEKLYD